jgi:hypothetical protein
MARTSSAAVQAILAGEYDGSTSLDGYIETASAVVDDVVVCAARKALTHTAARLELIERWLAAHYYQQADPGYQAKATASASATFVGETGMYLEGTRFGQTAARLDSSGCLAAIGGQTRRTAGAIWLGRPPSEQTDYHDRD